MNGSRHWQTAFTLALLTWGSAAVVAADPLRETARSEQSYLLVQFSSATCPACDEMQPVVQEVLERHPQVRFQEVDADLEAELSRRYDVKCVPVYVVLDPEGEVRFNDVGMRTPEELEQILEQVGVGGR